MMRAEELWGNRLNFVLWC